jgi:hypothetical protein
MSRPTAEQLARAAVTPFAQVAQEELWRAAPLRVLREAEVVHLLKVYAAAEVEAATAELQRRIEEYQHGLDELCVVLGPLTHPWEIKEAVATLKGDYWALAERLEQAERERDEARAEVERLREALIAAQGIVQSVQGGRRSYAPNAVYADVLFDCAHTDAVARQIDAGPRRQ